MYTVIARIFKNNKLVGYRIFNGIGRSIDVSIQEAWILAKNKQIIDVIATGNENEPGLSGINGFELKKLPEIKGIDEICTERAASIYNKLSNLSPDSIQENLTTEPTESEIAHNIKRQEQFEFNKLLQEAGYKKDDLTTLLANAEGNTNEEKAANLVKHLEAKKVEAKARELKQSKGFKGLFNAFKR